MLNRTQKTKRKPKRIPQGSRLQTVITVFAIFLSAATIIVLFKPNSSQSRPTNDFIVVTNSDDMILVPTPKRAVARGEKLISVPFTQTKWPKSRINDNYVKKIEEMKDAIALTSLPMSLPIPTSAITNLSLNSNAVVEGIPTGMRAISVRVDSESAVEGWARSGNYVDVILIRNSSAEENGLEAKLIAENIKILSVNRTVTAENSRDTSTHTPATVTLLVTQDAALTIKTAVNLGKLTFSLRGVGDNAPAESIQLTQRKLLGSATKVEQAPFKAFAKSPQGEVFALAEGSKWVKTELAPTSFGSKLKRGRPNQDPQN